MKMCTKSGSSTLMESYLGTVGAWKAKGVDLVVHTITFTLHVNLVMPNNAPKAFLPSR